MRLLIIPVIVLQLFCRYAVAQSFPDLRFEHITVKDGLSSNSVTNIAEDKQGFIWIGTTGGLNRYDGYRFKKYYHNNKDSNSLVNNGVQTLYCDSKGRLWICTEDGVSCLLTDENRFVNYSTRAKDGYRLRNNTSVRIYEDENGVIWIANQYEAIFKVLPGLTLEEHIIRVAPYMFYNIQVSGYGGIFRDQNGQEWAYNTNRVYRLDRVTKQPVQIFDLSPALMAQVLGMVEYEPGHFLLSTWSAGIWKFDPGGDVTHKRLTLVPPNIYTGLKKWSYHGQNWLACLEANRGMYLVNEKVTAARGYLPVPADPTAVQGSLFPAFFSDRKGNLWIASNYGVNRITASRPAADIFPVTDPGTVHYDPAYSSPVYSFFETDSSIWLSKRFVSTFEYDTSFRMRRRFTSLYPLSENERRENGTAYYFFRQGNSICMSTDSGLVVYDLRERRSRLYYPAGQAGGITFRTIIPLNEEEILIRTFDKGLFIFNIARRSFTHTISNTDTCDDCLPLRVNYLFKTRKGVIYLSSSSSHGKSLMRFNVATRRPERISPENDEQYGLQRSDLFGMDEDKDGRLWITSTAGLFIYDPATNRISQLNNDNEQISGLSRICFDKYGNAWANGNTAVWCYQASRKQWISFSAADGLPGSDFSGVITRRYNGDIVAGLEGGVAVFHPDKLTEKELRFPVIITEAAINGELQSFPLMAGAEKKLRLLPGKNSVSADFAILNYENPAATRYYYKLEPLQKEFLVNDNGHVNFNGLAPGHYTLYVRGGDKAGNLYDGEDRLDIYVMPRWYQTLFFKLAALLLFSLAVFYFIRRRITTIRKEASLNQRIAETEMQALRAQMNPHFIFNSLNSIENFIMLNEKRQASDYLNKFSRLVRSILDSSRNELVPLARDMDNLRLYVELEQLRFSNKFAYEEDTNAALLSGDYRVPSLLIQPYVENAIVHGIAHSRREDLVVKVKTELKGDYICYTIEDNGVGREQAEAYKRLNKPMHQSVGLQITSERIDHFNKGKITGGAIRFTDLYDGEGNPAGTRVQVQIKAV